VVCQLKNCILESTHLRYKATPIFVSIISRTVRTVRTVVYVCVCVCVCVRAVCLGMVLCVDVCARVCVTLNIIKQLLLYKIKQYNYSLQ
jgi:hypothetical protein